MTTKTTPLKKKKWSEKTSKQFENSQKPFENDLKQSQNDHHKIKVYIYPLVDYLSQNDGKVPVTPTPIHDCFTFLHVSRIPSLHTHTGARGNVILSHFVAYSLFVYQ